MHRQHPFEGVVFDKQNYSTRRFTNMLSAKKIESVSVLSMLLLLGWCSFAFAPAPNQLSDLEGTWNIDLRTSPNAPPYIVAMNITSVKNNKIKGTFYGSPIQHGTVNTQWGKVVFAFVTEDGSGAYHTAGELKDGVLTGSTHSIGRGFVSPWTGERKQ